MARKTHKLSLEKPQPSVALFSRNTTRVDKYGALIIRRCVFCKSEDADVEMLANVLPLHWRVQCSVCGANGPHALSVDKAIVLWNRRVLV